MSTPLKPLGPESSEPDDEASDPNRVQIDEARSLLDRAVQFLSRCQSDPEGAIEDDDPTEIIEGLRGIELHYLRGPHATEDPDDETEIRRSA